MSTIFPRWTNHLPTGVAVAVPLLGVGAVAAVTYWFSPHFTDVGYQPAQPVEYSHQLHAGELGIDCRYCHNTVEQAGYAAIPPNETCLNCHRYVATDSEKLEKVRQAGETGESIAWVKIHQLPDYAYFNHSVHVAAGVGCASCHGRIDQREVVALYEPLSMGWCLECHRNPEPHLRPYDEVTNMAYDPVAAGYDPDADPNRTRELAPPENCPGCHR